MTVHYLTIFDRNYLVPAFAQYSQIRRVSNSQIHFYTLDDEAAEQLRWLELDGATVRAPRDYIPEDIWARRGNWSKGAFAFMNKAVALEHLMDTDESAHWGVYFDVDVGVFDDPQVLINSLTPDISVQLTPHRFTPEFEHFERDAGRFNAGYVAFRNSRSGRQALGHWRELCFEWCHDVVDAERFGDQKYLERLAEKYPSVSVCSHPGANAAPWNIADKNLSLIDGRPQVEGEPLVFYHFQGLKQYNRQLIHLYASRDMIVSNKLLEYIYRPYINSLIKSADYLQQQLGVLPVYAKRTLKFRIYEFFMKMKGLPDNYHRLH